MKNVVIVGGGFAGLNAAKKLGGRADVRVTLVDRQNYHLFQPLLYQVAMAGLSPADIATPIRSVLARCRNISVLQGSVEGVDLQAQAVSADFGRLEFDYLLLCCGSMPSYFGHGDWEENAPSLKTIPQATEIRRRLLSAFEAAERTDDPETRRQLLTFVVIGGGPTGVELAGAIGEMSRFTLARDFRNIDTRLTRVILIESGPRILSMFSEQQAARAARDLEKLGVQVWPNTLATDIDEHGVQAGPERIASSTVLWAAGVRGVEVAGLIGRPGQQPERARTDRGSGVETDRSENVRLDRGGRVVVDEDLTIPGHPNVFVAGDQACFTHQTGAPLPGTAPVAIQQGRYVARAICRDLAGKPREPFRFVDRGQMATIGRSRAVAEIGKLRFSGWFAWITWLVVHVYFLVGFKNRLLVVLHWAWSYVTFRRGARLIVEREWRFGGRAGRKDKTVPAADKTVPAADKTVPARDVTRTEGKD
ncbi:MAG: NAD(P)/FAD-dependent oxidoreductase [Gemmatimonadetes bacterium]|nr:NAD(P)/FAD-dependent oxidoreductase [Gemmatimonadota bacterium]MYD26766.1 NAD(P)/FAD-dependent oxidoreductase [Gemmatimonadota bacterium]MYI99261.1 NAD(P)/FAD-dependent oxidoreductase [Gemmatimonadota bacterium]